MSHLCHSFRIHSACRLDMSFSSFTMVKVSTRKMKAAKASHKSPRHLQKNFQFLLAVTSAGLAVNSIAPLLFPTPMNTSILTGIAWLKELLAGHPVCFYDAISMPKHVFWKLVQELTVYGGLKNSKHVCAEEQVAIFLHMCKSGKAIREVWERFQHSPDTISKYVFYFVISCGCFINFSLEYFTIFLI